MSGISTAWEKILDDILTISLSFNQKMILDK